MKPLTSTGAIACALCAFSVSAQTLDDSVTKAHCAAEWANDFAMQKYCADRIAEGYQTHLSHRAKAAEIDNAQLSAALDNCMTEWLPDWTMVAYCENRHFEGVTQISGLLQELPEDVGATIFGQCLGEWPNDLTMQAYCFDQQATAWRDLQ